MFAYVYVSGIESERGSERVRARARLAGTAVPSSQSVSMGTRQRMTTWGAWDVYGRAYAYVYIYGRGCGMTGDEQQRTLTFQPPRPPPPPSRSK